MFVELVELIFRTEIAPVTLHRPEPLFDHYGIETEIDRLLRRKVWLSRAET